MVTVALLCVFGVGILLTGRVGADDCMGSSSQVSGNNRQHTYVCIAAKPIWDRVPRWCMRSSCLVNVSAVVYPALHYRWDAKGPNIGSDIVYCN